MHINGKIEKIDVKDDHVEYDISRKDKRYHVRSENKQAVKDAVFLRKGQKIEIRGTGGDGMILVRESRLDIRSMGKTYEDTTGIDRKD